MQNDEKIENELLERLQKGIYNDIYNHHTKALNKIIDAMEGPEKDVNEDELEMETEYVPYGKYDEEEEDDIEDFDGLPTGENDSDDDDDDVADDDVVIDRKRGRPDSKYALKKQERDAKKNKRRVLVEAEHEETDRRQKATLRI